MATDAERVTSGTNTGKLVWNGTNATTYAKANMGRKANLVVDGARRLRRERTPSARPTSARPPSSVSVSGPVVIATTPRTAPGR